MVVGRTIAASRQETCDTHHIPDTFLVLEVILCLVGCLAPARQPAPAPDPIASTIASRAARLMGASTAIPAEAAGFARRAAARRTPSRSRRWPAGSPGSCG